MKEIRAATSSEILSDYHQTLSEHFERLRTTRNELGSDLPVFALEHGLPPEEISLLQEAVRSSVSRGVIPRNSWIPLVIYAAELGYKFSGTEYWPTFERETPSWATHGDRTYIRRRFEVFAEKFGGARPRGPWANQFSIISWPITHAILPTDLQRQLAKLLYESASQLNSTLLGDTEALGQFLMRRSIHYSARFQYFAQNQSLLGQVAAGLLRDDEDEEPHFILESTLLRLVTDLSEEHEAREWLVRAKFHAQKIRAFGSKGASANSGANRSRPHRNRLKVRLHLRPDGGGWQALLRFPDFSSLSSTLPELHHELSEQRALIAGCKRPLARGRLAYPDQVVPLDRWPDPRNPLIALENASVSTNSLLADQCVISPGPTWLFRVASDGQAVEVSTGVVRPQEQYVLVRAAAVPASDLAWISPVALSAEGAYAVSLRIPDVLDDGDHSALTGLSLTPTGAVLVRPVGLVPISWDGDSQIEVALGEACTLAVATNRHLTKLICRLGDKPFIIPWEDPDSDLYLGFTDLEEGIHALRVDVFDGDTIVTQGEVELTVRPISVRPSTGSSGEGLGISASPAEPTLASLWHGDSKVQIRGPQDLTAKVEVSLHSRSNVRLAHAQRKVDLPVGPSDWSSLWAEFLKVATLAKAYDQAEYAEISIRSTEVGHASLICEREFTALRWVLSKSHGSLQAVLIDNTDSRVTAIDMYSPQEPTTRHSLPLSDGVVPNEQGRGLLVASIDGFTASVLVPPAVSTPSDLRNALVHPRFPALQRNRTTVEALIHTAGIWADAELPGDNPFARQQQRLVLGTLASRLAGLVGGTRWGRMEGQIEQGVEDLRMGQLFDAVGDDARQRGLAAEVNKMIPRWSEIDAWDRADQFANFLSEFAKHTAAKGQGSDLAEFLLRLASRPWTLSSWAPQKREEYLDVALNSPVLLRCARLAVLVTAMQSSDGTDSVLEEWTWN